MGAALLGVGLGRKGGLAISSYVTNYINRINSEGKTIDDKDGDECVCKGASRFGKRDAIAQPNHHGKPQKVT